MTEKQESNVYTNPEEIEFPGGTLTVSGYG